MEQITFAEAQKDPAVIAKNEAVMAAYNAIIKEVKELIPQYPTEQLRTYVERTVGGCTNVFLSPIVAISTDDLFGERVISFAKNFEIKSHVGFQLDTALIRCIYKHTNAHPNQINIEDRLEEYIYEWSVYEKSLNACKVNNEFKKTILEEAF